MSLQKKKNYNLDRYFPIFKKIGFEEVLLKVLDQKAEDAANGILADLSVGTSEIANEAISNAKLDVSLKSRMTNMETTQVNHDNMITALSTIHRRLHVEETGNDSTGTGIAAKPFKTIQAAIDHAESMIPVPAYTDPIAIICGPGHFSEKATIKHVGIHLYGFGQGVTQIAFNGTALEIKDNGVDPTPWDVKIVGMSIRSDNATEYSVVLQGIVGSSFGGNEIQLRDCRIEGTKALYANLVNYIDYQNTYFMGQQLYEQVAGVWFEESESATSITNDYDPAGSKPSDTGHYGLNFVRHLPRVEPTLLNSGIIGEDYRTQSITAKDIWDADITANRPGSPATGERFFDTTLGLPVWYNGAAWIDAAGNII